MNQSEKHVSQGIHVWNEIKEIIIELKTSDKKIFLWEAVAVLDQF